VGLARAVFTAGLRMLRDGNLTIPITFVAVGMWGIYDGLRK